MRADMQEVSTRLDTLLKSVSPSIGMPIRALNTGPDGAHIFFNSFVELLMRTDEVLDDELNKYGAAACHYALGSSKTKAGVNPMNFAEGKYFAAPRYRCTKERADIIGAASADARKHTLPPSGPIQLSQTQNDVLRRNMILLDKLNDNTCMGRNADMIETRNCDEVRVLVPFAAQLGNPLGMVNMVKLMEMHPGRVETSPVSGVAEFGGDQKGVFSVITLMGMK